MPTRQEEFNQMVSDLDAATNDIAADYAKLLSEAQTNTVSVESIAAAKVNIDRLKALGASVENPVPEPPTT
jgi:hypothetical protein